MGSIRCTLCCGETFVTLEELSLHLKNVLDNIFCSRCCLKFVNLQDLLQHYNRNDCQPERPHGLEPASPEKDSDELIKQDAVPIPSTNDEDKQDLPQGEGKSPENTSTSGNEDENSLNVLLSKECDTKAVVSSDNEGNGEGGNLSIAKEAVFLCSCGMKFSSIADHIMNFHCNEEVLVKGNSPQLDSLLSMESPKTVDSAYVDKIKPSQDSSSEDCEIIEEHAPSLENGDTEVIISNRSGQSEGAESVKQIESDLACTSKHTQDSSSDEPEIIEERVGSPGSTEPEVILCDRENDCDEGETNKPISIQYSSFHIEQLEGKVEECKDKDGRLYIRKFVRVEKFWTKTDEIKAAKKRSKIRNFEPVRDVPVGSVSVKSKDEAVSDKLTGSPKKLYQCKKCRKTFQTMIHFRYHVCTFINGPSTTCNLCGYESTTSKELRAHWRMHQRQRRYAATALWELQSSEGMSTSSGVPNEDMIELQCERCGEMYKKCDELIHIAMHEEEPPYKCKRCNETFDAKERLTRHMRSHREQSSRLCLSCGMSFSDSNALKLHVRSHTREKPFECAYCGKAFSRPYEKLKHERIHTGERPHVCEICGKTFRVSYCLTLHKRTHSGDRPYCCDTCGKRFKAHSAYKHHVQIHSEERNYKCPYCPKAFKTMVHLAGHKKTHTKPFSCTECNRRFASLYSVKAHMESHKTGDNRFRYRCFVCGASYARAFALQYHMQSHGPCDAPEDVAEVLEICEEDDKKDQSLSDIEDVYLDKKDEDGHQLESEVSMKEEDSSDSMAIE